MNVWTAVRRMPVLERGWDDPASRLPVLAYADPCEGESPELRWRGRLAAVSEMAAWVGRTAEWRPGDLGSVADLTGQMETMLGELREEIEAFEEAIEGSEEYDV